MELITKYMAIEKAASNFYYLKKCEYLYLNDMSFKEIDKECLWLSSINLFSMFINHLFEFRIEVRWSASVIKLYKYNEFMFEFEYRSGNDIYDTYMNYVKSFVKGLEEYER